MAEPARDGGSGAAMSGTWKIAKRAEAPSQLERLLEMSVREKEIEFATGGKFVPSRQIVSDYALSEAHAGLEGGVAVTRRTFVAKKPKQAAMLRAKYIRREWIAIRVVAMVEGRGKK